MFICEQIVEVAFDFLHNESMSSGFTAIPVAGGKSIPIWVDRFEPKDGRDNEAFLAFQKIAMVSTVRFLTLCYHDSAILRYCIVYMG